MLTEDTIFEYIRVRFPPPDSGWKWTSIDMERKSAQNRLADRSLGKHPPALVFRECIVNPSLVSAGLDDQPFQILLGKVPRCC